VLAKNNQVDNAKVVQAVAMDNEVAKIAVLNVVLIMKKLAKNKTFESFLGCFPRLSCAYKTLVLH
jgi:hypothetical protein